MTETSARYETVLRDWDDRSGVRAKPRRMLDEFELGKVAFPRALMTPAGHPLVEKHGRESKVLTERLYLYLDFTRALEQEIVNPVLLDLSRGLPPITLPATMRVDAHRIYVDEAYHALTAVDMNYQVALSSGVRYVPFACHAFQRAVQEKSRESGLDPRLVALCAAIVSETLISGTLTKIPHDENVLTAVRVSIADHAEDERTHHAYFTRLHDFVWPQLPRSTQQKLGPMFGDFIVNFLLPDLGAEREILVRAGLGTRNANEIVHDSYDGVDRMSEARRASRATLSLLRRSGVLDRSTVREHYEELGLLAA